MLSPLTKSLITLFTIFTLIISTILNILYRSEFYQMGVNFIFNYQQNNQTSGITTIQNLISILGNTSFIVAFLVVVHLLTYRKLCSIVYIFYIVINAYQIAVEKQAYQDPRPFHYDSHIAALQWTCPRSYGFPSGHSWVSVLLYEPVISDLIGTKGWRKFILIWIILTGVLIPISRQYLGSHTSDQVTSGVLHSLSFLILYRFVIQNQIYKLLVNSLKGNSKIIIVIVTTFAYLVSITIPFILYGVNNSSRQFGANYLARMNLACGKSYKQQDMQKQAGTASSIIGLVFGFIYGMLINSIDKLKVYYETEDKENKEEKKNNYLICYLLGKWNFKGSKINAVKFILAYALFGGVFVGGMGYGITAAINNFYGYYILQTLSYCLFGMSITCFIPLFLLYFQVIQMQVKRFAEESPNDCRTNEQLPHLGIKK